MEEEMEKKINTRNLTTLNKIRMTLFWQGDDNKRGKKNKF